MEILEKIFGSLSKLKIMKLFIFNPGTFFDTRAIARKTKVRTDQTKKDLNLLTKIGLVRHKVSKDARGKKVKGWMLEGTFAHLDALREFLLKVSPFTDSEIVRRMSKAGRLKFVVISGVFIDEPEARVDILIVGDKMKKSFLDRNLKVVEAELGKEIRYSILDTDDFSYRMGIGDKLMRDIFDYKHKVIFNKIGFAE